MDSDAITDMKREENCKTDMAEERAKENCHDSISDMVEEGLEEKKESHELGDRGNPRQEKDEK